MSLAIIIDGIILGLAFGGIFSLLSIGITPIYAVTRQINIAHGTFLTFALYLIFVSQRFMGLDPYISFVLTVPVFGLIGLFIFRYGGFGRLLNADPLLVFQFFLGYAFVLESIMLIGFGADLRSIPSLIAMHKTFIGPFVIRTAQIVCFIVSTLLCLGCHFIMMHTDIGRAIRAVAQNSEVASLMGINILRLQKQVLIFAFFLLAFAANLAAPWMTFFPYTGLIFTLFALIQLVMGGMGSFLGLYLAGLAIGLIYGISNAMVHSQMAGMIPYVFFVVVMIIKPQGLIARR